MRLQLERRDSKMQIANFLLHNFFSPNAILREQFKQDLQRTTAIALKRRTKQPPIKKCMMSRSSRDIAFLCGLGNFNEKRKDEWVVLACLRQTLFYTE